MRLPWAPLDNRWCQNPGPSVGGSRPCQSLIPQTAELGLSRSYLPLTRFSRNTRKLAGTSSRWLYRPSVNEERVRRTAES